MVITNGRKRKQANIFNNLKTLIHPTYFPTINTFTQIVNAAELVFEISDNYQKQTYRNRTYIYGANGKLALNIPVTHTHKKREYYKDIKIVNDTYWQSQHWKSLQSAYRTSPFFEFYEDDIAPLFTKKATHLLDFNIACIECIMACLQIDNVYTFTNTYTPTQSLIETKDLRHIAKVKTPHAFKFKPYTQVFENKYGFIENLSILDLLFNEGPNAITYLNGLEAI